MGARYTVNQNSILDIVDFTKIHGVYTSIKTI